MVLRSRLAHHSDWEDISRISRESGYMDYIGRIGPSYLDWGTVIVSEDEGMNGFLKVEFLPDGSGWLSGIRVDYRHRREGIATFLTREAVKYAADSGVSTLRMLIHEENVPSLKLAESCGFRRFMEFLFYEGAVDKSQFKETGTENGEYLFYVWKLMKAHGNRDQKGTMLSDGKNRIFLSSNDRNSFFHVMDGSFLAAGEGEDTIIVQRGKGVVEGAREMEDFDVGIVYEGNF